MLLIKIFANTKLLNDVENANNLAINKCHCFSLFCRQF